MLILALDTTTRAGSLSLVHDGHVLETCVGDAARTHATRLPGDILDVLSRHRFTLRDVGLYGVAAGPGSFTGLRIGIATIQGLAFAHGRLVAGVSALDALVEADGQARPAAAGELRAAWMDAQRGEVYACLYRRDPAGWAAVAGPVVAAPAAVLTEWGPLIGEGALRLVGDGAAAYVELLRQALGSRAAVADPVPPLAPAIAALADRAHQAGRSGPPHAIRPLYIRRPDAELVRERRAGLTS
jgi:tRNA threonylcarbamoyladenosine biosynthesis protein TsaB